MREPIPYTLHISGYLWTNGPEKSEPADGSSGTPFMALQQTIMLPDTANNRVLPISRRPLVQDGTKITLSNGMVQSREDIRPSIFYAVLNIPKTILTAIVPIPGSGSGGGGSGAGSGNGAGSGSGQSGSGQSGAGQQGQTGSTGPSASPPLQ